MCGHQNTNVSSSAAPTTRLRFLSRELPDLRDVVYHSVGIVLMEQEVSLNLRSADVPLVEHHFVCEHFRERIGILARFPVESQEHLLNLTRAAPS